MLITFEGIDGSGKTTQINLLAEYLQAKSNDVLVLREPGGTELSEQIRELLLSNKNEINSHSELFLFEAARSDLVSKVIKPALQEDKIVICDRFYDSTTAYQGYGRGLPLDTINMINSFATFGIVPDITFYLKVSIETSKERTKEKRLDRIENAGDSFFNKIITGFEKIASKEPDRFFIINSDDNIKNIHQNILKIVEKKLL